MCLLCTCSSACAHEENDLGCALRIGEAVRACDRHSFSFCIERFDGHARAFAFNLVSRDIAFGSCSQNRELRAVAYTAVPVFSQFRIAAGRAREEELRMIFSPQ